MGKDDYFLWYTQSNKLGMANILYLAWKTNPSLKANDIYIIFIQLSLTNLFNINNFGLIDFWTIYKLAITPQAKREQTFYKKFLFL